jgi:toxin FitB
MTWLLDTNVVSEIGKGVACDARLRAWLDHTSERELYVSVLVLGELRKGIELARRRDPVKAVRFEARLQMIEQAFTGRLVPVDAAIADEWGYLNGIRPLPVIDSLLAATAKVRELILVTRDIKSLADLGVRVLDPFAT